MQKFIQNFLYELKKSDKSVADIIQLLHKLMRKAKCHPHFFGNNTLRQNAEFLTFYSLNLPHEYKNPHYLNKKISAEDVHRVMTLALMRITEKIPIEYLIEEARYLDFTFYVNQHVLVPRSIMHTRFKDFLNEATFENHRVLDLCTGSGCIGITLALMNPSLKIDLVDISPEALAVAKKNIEKYHLQDRVQCIQSDLFKQVPHPYDLIISNPPYVSSYEYRKAHAEFKNEPKIALEAGWDGLDIIHRMLAEAKQYLNPNGQLIVETGFASARRLKRRYPNLNFQWFKYRRPNGKVALLSMDGIFRIKAEDLPLNLHVNKPSYVYRLIDRIRDVF